MSQSPETRYGLPTEVVYCKNCVMSNQRPTSTPEFRHTVDRKHNTLHIDDEGICDACRYMQQKENIDWPLREKELLKLLDRYRRNDGGYDCIVPGSGGKDSCYAAHVLKYKYGMHPLTITWPPLIYTDIGYKNFRAWIDIGGFDNLSFNYNGQVHALLTRLAIENLLHPFQPFILGQKNLAPKIALKYDIPLIFYGENEAEYGNPIADNQTSLRDKSYYTMQNLSEVRLGGISVDELFDRYPPASRPIRCAPRGLTANTTAWTTASTASTTTRPISSSGWDAPPTMLHRKSATSTSPGRRALPWSDGLTASFRKNISRRSWTASACLRNAFWSFAIGFDLPTSGKNAVASGNYGIRSRTKPPPRKMRHEKR